MFSKQYFNNLLAARHVQVENHFLHLGLPCWVTASQAGHRSGYVGVPIDTPGLTTSHLSSPACDIKVHGGVSYAGFYMDPKTSASCFVYGFDCGKAGHGKLAPATAETSADDTGTADEIPQERVWSIEDVVQEVKCMAAQFAFYIDLHRRQPGILPTQAEWDKAYHQLTKDLEKAMAKRLLPLIERSRECTPERKKARMFNVDFFDFEEPSFG